MVGNLVREYKAQVGMGCHRKAHGTGRLVTPALPHVDTLQWQVLAAQQRHADWTSFIASTQHVCYPPSAKLHGAASCELVHVDIAGMVRTDHLIRGPYGSRKKAVTRFRQEVGAPHLVK
jgi:hypothetical protein